MVEVAEGQVKPQAKFAAKELVRMSLVIRLGA
jgi:hypothetical protein